MPTSSRCMAPKPVIILAKEKDYFDVRGAEETYARLKHLYTLLGAEENIKLHIGPTGHGYTIENREAMYRLVQHAPPASRTRRPSPSSSSRRTKTLWCTPKGQVSELKSRTVFSFTEEKAKLLATKRVELEAGALTDRLAGLLQLPRPEGTPEYRILRALGNRKYPKPHATTYAIETEKGILATVYRLSDQAHYSRPTKSDKPAILYVSHHSADVELRDEPLLAELVKAEPNTPFYAMDVRGVGESRPDTCGGSDQFLKPYGNDFFYAIHGIMLDRPYVGQKTFDVLRVLDWLGAVGHKEVHLVAKGWGAIPATFAAVLSESSHARDAQERAHVVR